MINLYAYTYPSAAAKFQGFVLTKVGDSHRDVNVRMNEQGAAAEYEKKIKVGSWPNLQKIQRDYDVHEILKARGLTHNNEGAGTEWFKIPGKTVDDVFKYIDAIVTGLEGKRIRKSVKLREVQQKTLAQAMAIIESVDSNAASLVANLCPRFGKTIWALSLFNEINKKYGNRVMLLPAYWLSVHSSFINELDAYEDFSDMVQIDTDDPEAASKAAEALDAGLRIVVPISLHGDFSAWCDKHEWLTDIELDDIFMFADEGDFGTHTENQVKKLEFLFAEHA